MLTKLGRGSSLEIIEKPGARIVKAPAAARPLSLRHAINA